MWILGWYFWLLLFLGGEVKGEENGSLQACSRENEQSTLPSPLGARLRRGCWKMRWPTVCDTDARPSVAGDMAGPVPGSLRPQTEGSPLRRQRGTLVFPSGACRGVSVGRELGGLHCAWGLCFLHWVTRGRTTEQGRGSISLSGKEGSPEIFIYHGARCLPHSSCSISICVFEEKLNKWLLSITLLSGKAEYVYT